MSILDKGIKSNPTNKSKTVYGKRIFLDKIYVKTDIPNKKNKDKDALKKVTSMI